MSEKVEENIKKNGEEFVSDRFLDQEAMNIQLPPPTVLSKNFWIVFFGRIYDNHDIDTASYYAYQYDPRQWDRIYYQYHLGDKYKEYENSQNKEKAKRKRAKRHEILVATIQDWLDVGRDYIDYKRSDMKTIVEEGNKKVYKALCAELYYTYRATLPFPSTYNNQLRNKFLSSVKAGLDIERAAASVGIPLQQVNSWIECGQEDITRNLETALANFVKTLDQHLAHNELKLLRKYEAAMNGKPKYIMDMLKVINPERYHDKFAIQQEALRINAEQMKLVHKTLESVLDEETYNKVLLEFRNLSI